MKNKTLSLLATFALTFAMLAPLTLAEDQYLPDVENLAVEALVDSIKLTWDPVEGADSYTIYYGIQSISEDGASYENDVLLGNVTEHTVENLTAGTPYYFSAAADDSTGTYLGSYNYSEEVSGTPTETPAPTADPLPTPDPVDPPSALEVLLQDEHPAPTTPPASLPQSGPATAALALVSGAGAYFWRKFRK
jgi:hypothetical protein